MKKTFLNKSFLTILFSIFVVIQVFAADPLMEGFLLLEKGQYSKAFSNFSSIKKELPQKYTGMGIAKYFEKDYEKSLSLLKIALGYKLEQKNWVPYYFSGLSSYELEKYDDAERYLKKANALKHSSETLLWLGKSHYMLKRFSTAEHYLREFLKEDAKNKEVYELLFKIYEETKNTNGALNLIEQARKNIRDDPMLIFYERKLLPQDNVKTMDGIKPTQQPLEKPLSFNSKTKTKKAYEPTYFIFTVSLFFAFSIFYYVARRELEKKLEFTNDLIKNMDIKGAQEMLSTIKFFYTDELKLLRIKIAVLKQDYHEALNLCENLRNKKLKEEIKAYIYLILDDKNNIDKLVAYAEITNNLDLIQKIPSMSLKNKKELINDFVNL